MKAIFVDGPSHGNTIQLEGRPSEVFYLPAMAATSVLIEADDPRASASVPKYEYRLRARTRNGTFIYEYAGVR